MSEEEKNLRKEESPEDSQTAKEIDKNAENNVITDDVIAVIAGVATMEVNGVADMSSGLAGNIAEALGRKNPSKGVKVTIEGNEAAIDLYIIVKYGFRIPEIAWNVQEKVKETVETLSSIFVTEVNIHVQGVDFSQYDEEKAAKGGNEE